MPNNEEPFRALSSTGGTPGGTLLINNPYNPIPKINMTVPARYTSTQEYRPEIYKLVKINMLSPKQNSAFQFFSAYLVHIVGIPTSTTKLISTKIMEKR
jgi:hypothetical protein